MFWMTPKKNSPLRIFLLGEGSQICNSGEPYLRTQSLRQLGRSAHLFIIILLHDKCEPKLLDKSLPLQFPKELHIFKHHIPFGTEAQFLVCLLCCGVDAYSEYLYPAMQIREFLPFLSAQKHSVRLDLKAKMWILFRSQPHYQIAKIAAREWVTRSRQRHHLSIVQHRKYALFLQLLELITRLLVCHISRFSTTRTP